MPRKRKIPPYALCQTGAGLDTASTLVIGSCMFPFPHYSSDIENISIYGAFAFFATFLVYIVADKTAAGTDSYTRVNRVHSRIFLAYFCVMVVAALAGAGIDRHALLGIATGAFIYFSLHYVFVFALIGVCRKSISVGIMAAMQALESEQQLVTPQSLESRMQAGGIGIRDLRDSRLGQMVHLGFAQEQTAIYSITRLGRCIHAIGAWILAIYGLKRL